MSERLQVIICALVIAMTALWLPYYQLEAGSLLNQYDYARSEVWQQPWRILTAHVFHLDATHAIYNAVGLLIVTALFAQHFTVRTWFNALAIIALVCVITVWLIGLPERFVGLSGLIHGLLLTSLLLEWSKQGYAKTDWLSPLAIGLLCFKVLLEMLNLMHSSVLLSAGDEFGYIHLGGLLGGIVACRLHRKRLASIAAQPKPDASTPHND